MIWIRRIQEEPKSNTDVQENRKRIAPMFGRGV